jgi:hypothetical protein
MKTKLLAKTCILSLLLIAMAEIAFAQTIVIGVTKGNTFDYNYTLLWETTDPSAKPPADYIEMNNTQWFRLSIADVSGYLIRVETTLHFKNGTETIKNGTVDTYHEAINVPFGFLLIRANSNPNERIYPDGSNTIVNETITRTYPNGNRETNRFITEFTTESTYERTEIFFDRATGAAVEFQYEGREKSGSYETTTKEIITIQSSNVWTIPEFPAYAILLILTFTSLFIVLYGKKLRAPRIHKGRTIPSYKFT